MKQLHKFLKKTYDSLDNIFTDKEAWTLFRYSAWLESVGWICLLIGIYAVNQDWYRSNAYIAVGGSIHGIFYLAYTAIVLFTHRSMDWSVPKLFVSFALSNVPFGALGFEMYEARRRKKRII